MREGISHILHKYNWEINRYINHYDENENIKHGVFRCKWFVRMAL